MSKKRVENTLKEVEVKPQSIESSTTFLDTIKLHFHPLFIIFCSALFLYANTIKHDYALDDQMVIYENKFVTAGTDSLKKILTTDAFEGFFGERGSQLISGGRYRPLSYISFALEWKLFGRNPMMSHIVNILIYALLCSCIYLFLLWLFPPDTEAATNPLKLLTTLPFIATMLYTFHPIHTEVVANIKGRDELYGFLFGIIAILYFFRIHDKSKILDYFSVFFFFFLAIMSKENMITFVLIIPILAYMKRIKLFQSRFILTFSMVLTATGLYLLLRIISTKVGLHDTTYEILNNPFVRANSSEQYGTIIYSYFRYFLLLIFPHSLTHDYYFNQIPYRKLSDSIVLLTLIGIIGLFYILIQNWKKRNEVFFGILFFLISFSIVSNLVFTVGIIMNERFIFISSLGFCVILAWLILKMKNKKVIYAILIPIFLLYSYKTISRNMAWKDNYTLFSTDYHISNNSAKVSTSFGGSLVDKAVELAKTDSILSKQLLDSGIQVLRHSLEIYPENSQTWLLYGNAIYSKTNSAEEAINIYKTALYYRPNYFDAFYNLGIVNFNIQQLDSAQLYLEKALAANPNHKESKALLGKIYARLGRAQDAINLNGGVTSMGNIALEAYEGKNYQEAFSLAEQALFQNSDDYNANFVKGICLAKQFGKLQDGIPYLEKAVKLNPNNGYWMEDLAVAYGMTGQIKKTIPLLEKVIQLRPEDPDGYKNLATTYFNLGDKEKANYYLNLSLQKSK